MIIEVLAVVHLRVKCAYVTVRALVKYRLRAQVPGMSEVPEFQVGPSSVTRFS